MKIVKLLMAVGLLFINLTAGADTRCNKNLDFTVRALNNNQAVNLCQTYAGKVVLIVNTASKCAFTGQYEGLEALYNQYKDAGLVVLGFPSNDFGNQEPGTEKQIQEFCRTTYGVQFPMFQKSKVSKHNADPLFKQLGEQAGYPNWNFHKYLLDRDGQLVQSFGSMTTPDNRTFQSKLKELLF